MPGKYSKGFVLLERPVPPEKKNDITEKYQVVIDVAVTDEDHWIQRVWCSTDLLLTTVAETLRTAAEELDFEVDV
jgi:hypothetical protein